MNYEALLEKAYETVKQTEVSERFEVMGVKGHHQGVRTIILNVPQITAHLRRNQDHLLKFLSKELASQAEYQNGKVTFSRKLASKDINSKIQKYVTQFVLCATCKKPDTELITEGQKTIKKCLACGEKREVHKV